MKPQISDSTQMNADFRNAVEISYVDELTGKRKVLTLFDQGSVKQHGERRVKIYEPLNSPIRSEVDAARFAKKVLEDLMRSGNLGEGGGRT